MAEKDQVTYDAGPDAERRRSSVAALNLDRNLDAKYVSAYSAGYTVLTLYCPGFETLSAIFLVMC